MGETSIQPLLYSQLKSLFTERYGSTTDLKVVRVPYRICPLGAHSDHQGGTVLGMAIDQGVTFLWRVRKDAEVKISSLGFPGDISFSLDDLPPAMGRGFWGDYAVGAAWSLLQKNRTLSTGIEGVIGGDLPVGGLSSSAAVSLANGIAFRIANSIGMDAWDVVTAAVDSENGYVGVSCGLLDPATIFFAETGNLVRIDCRDREVDIFPRHDKMLPCSLGIVFCGVERSLVRSNFNERVSECFQAAKCLGERVHREDAVRRLIDITPEEHERHEDQLPQALRLRAEHFFSEQARVHKGLKAWQEGDIVLFGSLVTESGSSSIVNYEAGCPEVIYLWELLSEIPGVYGTRFSGGGFGGAVIALVDPEQTGTVEEQVRYHYLDRHPDYAPLYRVEVRSSGSGPVWGDQI